MACDRETIERSVPKQVKHIDHEVTMGEIQRLIAAEELKSITRDVDEKVGSVKTEVVTFIYEGTCCTSDVKPQQSLGGEPGRAKDAWVEVPDEVELQRNVDALHRSFVKL